MHRQAMLPGMLVLLGAYLLALTGCGGTRVANGGAGGGAPGTGSIYVTSVPSGAGIRLDGAATGGVTPATLTDVPAGLHQIILTLAGYADWGQSVIVASGQTSTVSATLVPGGTGTNLIAFSSNRTGDWDIYLMNTDGSDQENITNSPFTGDDEPCWSPDGAQIAFVSCATGQEQLSQIWVMNSDGSNRHQITFSPGQAGQPAWSPDGSTIAYANYLDGSGGVWFVNPDGSNPRKIIDDARIDTRPRFSLDGAQVAFTSGRDGNSEVYVMRADGTELTNLTNNPAWDGWASWSPDGSHLAFATSRDLPPDSGWQPKEIYVMTCVGSNPTRVTNNALNDTWPEWSPEGQWIVFERWAGEYENHEVYKMRPDGSQQTNLTNVPGADDEDGVWGVIG